MNDKFSQHNRGRPCAESCFSPPGIGTVSMADEAPIAFIRPVMTCESIFRIMDSRALDFFLFKKNSDLSLKGLKRWQDLWIGEEFREPRSSLNLTSVQGIQIIATFTFDYLYEDFLLRCEGVAIDGHEEVLSDGLFNVERRRDGRCN